MIKKEVYSKPDKFEAVQYDGTANVDLANWCNGSYRPAPNDVDGVWALFFGFNDAVTEGTWVVKNSDGIFFGIGNDEFVTEYVEKVSYENQSS